MSYALSILGPRAIVPAGSPEIAISRTVVYSALAGELALGVLGYMLGTARHRGEPLMGAVYAAGAMAGVPAAMYAAGAIAARTAPTAPASTLPPTGATT